MFLLSFLLLHEERSMIRSRNKALSGVSSSCDQTPENTSAIQYRYQVSMVIWKIYIFSPSPECLSNTLKENNTFFNAILTKIVSGITVVWVIRVHVVQQQFLLPCLVQVYTFASQDTFEPCQRLTIFFPPTEVERKGHSC